MLFEYIERVRNEPKDVRKRIAFFWSAVFTGTIVLVWLSVIIGREYAERGGTAEQITDVVDTTAEDTRTRFNAANDFLQTVGDVTRIPSAVPPATSTTTGTTTATIASTTIETGTGTRTPATQGTPALWP